MSDVQKRRTIAELADEAFNNYIDPQRYLDVEKRYSTIFCAPRIEVINREVVTLASQILVWITRTELEAADATESSIPGIWANTVDDIKELCQKALEP